jgi:hypothetical protein
MVGWREEGGGGRRGREGREQGEEERVRVVGDGGWREEGGKSARGLTLFSAMKEEPTSFIH